MPYSNIDKPSKYFDTKLYTGNGSSQSITGLSFSPDFVWVKDRTSANSHNLSDIVRGATKTLFTDATNAEVTDATRLTSFNSDGFSVGSSGSWNTNTNNYVSWNWDANGAGVSNTSGTITSTVSANTTSGFSVCTYTGDGGTTTSSTIGHGLGVAPKIYFLKGRSEVGDWIVASSMFTNLQFLKLNLTNALASGGTAQYVMNSSTISVPARNTSGQTYVAYCFAEVKGYSKFGSYTGNGNVDGPFVYTGFKPAFVITKITSTTGNWFIQDNRRTNSFNVVNGNLYTDLSNAENTNNFMDFLSNGFKFRLDGGINTSGATYIYMAFADNPFVSSKGIPTTAR